jgi:adenylate cyclase
MTPSFFKTSWHFETARWAWGLRMTLLSLIAGLLFLFSGGWSSFGFYSRLEADFLDSLTRWQIERPAAQTPEKRITIIDIDEASLEAFGSWPWPRTLTAQLIEQSVRYYQVKALGLDIVFPDITRSLDDQALQRALHLPGVVLAQAFDLNPIGTPPQAGHLAAGRHLNEPGFAVPSVLSYGYVANHPDLVTSLSKSSVCVGHITPTPSQDGVVRHIAPWVRYQDQIYPMLAVSMLLCSGQASDHYPEYRVSTQALYLEKLNQWRLVWPKSISSFTVVSAKDVLSRQIDPSMLKGRYVLIGSSALGIGDRVATPLAPWLPGVMVHAQILSFMLNHEESFIHTTTSSKAIRVLGGDAWYLGVLYAITLAMLITWILFHSHLVAAIAVAVGGSILWLVLAIVLFQSYWHTTWILPWVTVFLLSLLYIPMEWLIAQDRHRSSLRRLGVYLAPTVLKRMLSEGLGADLKPKRANITVLFVDVENYTALSETLSPETLTLLTQAILSELTDAVHDQAGTLDKYMGDAVMAFWGAPLEQADHADRAIACALNMQTRIMHHRHEWQDRYGLKDMITVRIGINTGDVVVGEMGSAIRRTYTAIGDAVNVAARLQEQAKLWQHPILLGEACARASQAYQVIQLGSLTFRGKQKPEMIYSLPQFDRARVPV